MPLTVHLPPVDREVAQSGIARCRVRDERIPELLPVLLRVAKRQEHGGLEPAHRVSRRQQVVVDLGGFNDCKGGVWKHSPVYEGFLIEPRK